MAAKRRVLGYGSWVHRFSQTKPVSLVVSQPLLRYVPCGRTVHQRRVVGDKLPRYGSDLSGEVRGHESVVRGV